MFVIVMVRLPSTCVGIVYSLNCYKQDLMFLLFFQARRESLCESKDYTEEVRSLMESKCFAICLVHLLVLSVCDPC